MARKFTTRMRHTREEGKVIQACELDSLRLKSKRERVVSIMPTHRLFAMRQALMKN